MPSPLHAQSVKCRFRLALLLCALPGLLLAETPGAGPDPLTPIEVGPKEEVGKEGFAGKQGKKVVSGIISGVLGGESRRGDKGPKTRRDPTRKQEYQFISRAPGDTETGARARWTEDGLLVSARIEESDDKGTFQTIFLQDCSGRRLYPVRIDLYKIWAEHSLSVSWTRTTSVDGQVVGRESGGWSDTWTEDLGTHRDPGETAAGEYPPIWQQVGYDRAQAGVQQLGAYFNLDPEALAGTGDLALVTHVTLPDADPVTTVPFNWLISAGDEEQPGLSLPDAPSAGDPASSAWDDWAGRCVTPATGETGEPAPPGVSAPGGAADPADRETRSDWGGSAAGAKPPCEEAVTRIEKAENDFKAALYDPAPLLRQALAAAQQVGQATAALGRAQAQLAAEQARLDAAEDYLEAWDLWFEEKLEKRAASREALHGSRTPSWAKGSDERSRRRHQERSAGLRAEVEALRNSVAQAQQAVAQAQAVLASAQAAFRQYLAAFANALAKLRGAKDLFTEEVTIFYRCSPCETIAGYFASAARLNDLLDRIRGMLEQARARVAAQHAQAQVTADAAAAEARAAADRLAGLEQRRAEIEQEMRDAVDTSDGCLSFDPIEGGSWMNLASMDRVRSTVVPEGAAMGWRSNFKGSDVRVYTRRGCLQAKIENIRWNTINALNRELTDLQAELAEAGREQVEKQLAADLAQAAADGLKAELDAIDELLKALANSGIEQNTEDVLDHLDALSKECATQLKGEIEKIKDARERKRKADERIAGAGGTADGLRRRAGAAADELDGMDPSAGTDEDRDQHDKLKGKADDLAGSGPGGWPDTGYPPSPVPSSLVEAEEQRKAAEDAADAAEDAADAAEEEVSDLADEVEDLEDEVDELSDRLEQWRWYWAALARYQDCLKEKQKALEELAELETGAASALRELADMIGETASALDGAASDTKDISSVSKKAKAANDKAAKLAGAMEDLSKAMKILDTVLNADHALPSEKLKAMSDAFELLRKALPDLPGVSQMLEFYNEAMKAIAGKIAEIEEAQIERFVEAGMVDEDYIDLAPAGIQEEVRRLVKIKKLMKIITRDCGNPPTPPAVMVYAGR